MTSLRHPTVIPLVSEEAFAAALSTAADTRVLRYILWQRATESGSCSLEPRIKWHRIAAKPTMEPVHRLIAQEERFSNYSPWLVTVEHHDVLGNFFRSKGEQVLPSWQPGGPGLLRTADNPHHWIPINCFYLCPSMAPIAVSDVVPPTEWGQPKKPHYQAESDVWVHFTVIEGPFTPRNILTKMKAPRCTTEAMLIFLKHHDTETPSAADMTISVLTYIREHNLLVAGDRQTVIPDDSLKALLSVTEPFRLTELQRLLEPHYGPFI